MINSLSSISLSRMSSSSSRICPNLPRQFQAPLSQKMMSKFWPNYILRLTGSSPRHNQMPRKQRMMNSLSSVSFSRITRHSYSIRPTKSSHKNSANYHSIKFCSIQLTLPGLTTAIKAACTLLPVATSGSGETGYETIKTRGLHPARTSRSSALW